MLKERMTSTIENSKRVKAFRRELIATVPRFPNDKASLQAMEAKDLTDLLITFIGWRIRYVAQRPRRVAGSANLASDARAAALKPNIDAFIAAVEAGNDLTPYLSLDTRTRGYTPAADPKTPRADTWADKDFLLNVMGLHHFHLGLTMEAAGHAVRTNEVLFASVTRDALEIIGLFDHDAFEHEDDGTMTPERVKLWQAYHVRETAGTLPGQLMVGGYANLGITLSSQPVAVVRTAQRHVKIIRENDPKLDDPEFVKKLYGNSGAPAKPKLKWCYVHLDFGVCDDAAGFFGAFERGPN
jgi:hypothetical protein